VLENQISILLGRTPGPIARGTPLDERTPIPEVPAGIPASLLERRPDVLEAEYAARAANAQIGVAIGNFLPKIGLSAILGAVTEHLQDITNHGSALWAAGAQVSGPIFQGGTLKGAYIQSKALWEEANLQYQQAVLNALADASNALVSKKKYTEVRVQQETEVRAYREAVEVASQRYKSGSASYYELLQAQQLLFPAESALAQTRRDEMTSYVQIYKALGGGWNVSDSAWIEAK
jgi:multidrug efflux system outer membrane protein